MNEQSAAALKKIENFDIAMRMRDFEIGQLTTRNNFFMIFQGVLFAGLVQSTHSKPIVSVLVCVVGLLVSVFQIGMASGAKFWQEYWEAMLTQYEQDARQTPPELFHEDLCTYEKVVSSRLRDRGLS